MNINQFKLEPCHCTVRNGQASWAHVQLDGKYILTIGPFGIVRHSGFGTFPPVLRETVYHYNSYAELHDAQQIELKGGKKITLAFGESKHGVALMMVYGPYHFKYTLCAITPQLEIMRASTTDAIPVMRDADNAIVVWRK